MADMTERLYDRLPEVFRVEDEQAADSGVLKWFLSGTGDQLTEVSDLLERFDTNGPDELSELVDPAKADDAWLDYIGQLLGVGRLTSMTPVQKRAVLADPSIGYKAGTVQSICAAASTVVGGSGYVGLYNHTTDVSAIGAASQWDVLLVTRSGEALSDPAQRVIELGAKPAGIRLYHRVWQVTWTDIHTNYPTWAQINALPNWGALERTGI